MDLADFVVLLDLERLRFARWKERVMDSDTGTKDTTHQNIRIEQARHDTRTHRLKLAWRKTEREGERETSCSFPQVDMEWIEV